MDNNFFKVYTILKKVGANMNICLVKSLEKMFVLISQYNVLFFVFSIKSIQASKHFKTEADVQFHFHPQWQNGGFSNDPTAVPMGCAKKIMRAAIKFKKISAMSRETQLPTYCV